MMMFPISVLKLLKMAKGIRALLDTVMQALPQVGNLGLLFFLLFFIFAALGVEMFGRLGSYNYKYQPLLFLILLLTLFRTFQNVMSTTPARAWESMLTSVLSGWPS